MASRRTWRTATRAVSAYLCAILTSSLRRSSLSSGMRRRSICPSVAGDSPRLELMIAFSTACTSERSQTLTAIRRGSGTLTLAHLIERHLRAVGVDHHRIEHMGGGAAGAQAGQFGLEHGAGALHAALDFVDIVRFVCHGDPPNTTPLALQAAPGSCLADRTSSGPCRAARPRSRLYRRSRTR